MNWPNHSDYAEAVQNPEICFELPELHTGMVATTALGLPRALSGNFATVYEVAGGGERFAVRCFVRQVTNQQDRYAALERHLEGTRLPFMVPFEFVNRGIRVQERWYPIVKMQWVTGVPFHNYVEQQLVSPERLAWLAADWRSLAAELKNHRIGHGDLQHSNILVTPEGDLRLVDYDGMYVPLFAGQRSPELGHANYQHPRRAAEFYNERLDHFSEILIYLSLRALAAEPSLWDEYFNGDNLIATAVDLRVPQCSNLWPRLLESPDQDVRRLTVLLIRHLTLAATDVPSLEQVLNEDLAQTVVPAQLEFPNQASSPLPVDNNGSDPETALLVEVFAERAISSRPGRGMERPTNGSRPVSFEPRLADVFGWSALVTMLLALVPPLHTVGGLSAISLAILAWLMPGRLLQPARLAAALSAFLGLGCVWLGSNLTVAARLEANPAPLPLEKRIVKPPAAIIEAPATPAPEHFKGHAVVLKPLSARPGGSAVPTSASGDPNEMQAMARQAFRWHPHTETVSAIILSADQRHLISASTDRSLAVWDFNRESAAFVRTNLVEPVISLTALTNVGIVAALDAMHQLQWWSLDGAVPLKSTALDPDSLVHPTISPNGQMIALGGENRRQIALCLNTTPPTRELISGLNSWAKLVRFSPDSRLMAIVCHDDTISLHRSASAIPIHDLRFPDANISDVRFVNGNTQVVAIGEQGAMRIWNVSDGSVVTERRLDLKQPLLTELTDDRSGQYLVAAGKRVLLLTTADGLATHGELDVAAPITAIVRLPGAKGFACGHQSGEVSVWTFPAAPVNGVLQMARP